MSIGAYSTECACVMGACVHFLTWFSLDINAVLISYSLYLTIRQWQTESEKRRRPVERWRRRGKKQYQ